MNPLFVARRDFLRFSAIGFSSVALAACLSAQETEKPKEGEKPEAEKPKPKWDLSKVKRGTLLGCGSQVRKDTGEKRFTLCTVDLDVKDILPRITVMEFLGHGYAPDPRDPTKMVIFEKHGPGACEVDLATQKVTRKIEATKGTQFYGHGAFSPDGSILYCTETYTEDKYRGIIAIRDGTTFKHLGEFPTFGAAPHDCHLVDDGKVMVITNGGGKLDGAVPNVTYVDVKKQELVEKIEFDDPNTNSGHLVVGAKGDLAISHARREGLPESTLGGVSVRPKGGKLKTLKEPKATYEKMVGETLSICFNEDTRIVAATNPYGDVVTFWDMDSGELKKELVSKNARGIALTLDRKFYVLSYGRDYSAVGLMDATTLKPVAGSKFDNAPITGSHTFMHAAPAFA